MIIVDANPAATTVFGYSFEEMMGQNVKILMPIEMSDRHDSFVNRYRKTGDAHIINQAVGRRVKGLRKDGAQLDLVLTISESIIDSSRKFTAVFQDVTEQEHQRQLAALSQKRTAKILHTMAVPAIVADVTMKIIDVNAAAFTVFGYTDEELIGQNVSILMQEDMANKHDAIVHKYIETKKSSIVNEATGRRVQGRHKDGFRLELVLTVSETEFDGMKNFTAVFQDVTEQEHQRHLAMVQHKRTINILYSMSAPAIVADLEMMIVDTNPAASRVFGFSYKELIGQNVKILMPEEMANNHDAHVSRYTSTGNPHIVNQDAGRRVQGRHKDGSRLELVLTLSESTTWAEGDDNGARIFTAVFQDVTEQERQRTKMVEHKVSLRNAFRTALDSALREDKALHRGEEGFESEAEPEEHDDTHCSDDDDGEKEGRPSELGVPPSLHSESGGCAAQRKASTMMMPPVGLFSPREQEGEKGTPHNPPIIGDAPDDEATADAPPAPLRTTTTTPTLGRRMRTTTCCPTVASPPVTSPSLVSNAPTNSRETRHNRGVDRGVDRVVAVVSNPPTFTSYKFLERSHSALMHLNDATRQGAAGDMEQTIESLENCLIQCPDLAVAHTLLGIAHGQRGNIDKALSSLQHSWKLNPADPNTFGYLMSNLMKKGDTESTDRACATWKSVLLRGYQLGDAQTESRSELTAFLQKKESAEIHPQKTKQTRKK